MSQAAGYVARSSALPAGAVIDAETLIRSILFIAVFLSFWISFHPFPSLAKPMSAHAQEGDWVNQVGFSLVFLLLAAWTACHEREGQAPRREFRLPGRDDADCAPR